MRNSTGECGERFNLWSKKVLIQNIKAVYFKKILIITCNTQLYTIAGFYEALEEYGQPEYIQSTQNEYKVLFEIDTLVDVKRSRGTIWHWQMKHM